jgi:hypothetical protein
MYFDYNMIGAVSFLWFNLLSFQVCDLILVAAGDVVPAPEKAPYAPKGTAHPFGWFPQLNEVVCFFCPVPYVELGKVCPL